MIEFTKIEYFILNKWYINLNFKCGNRQIIFGIRNDEYLRNYSWWSYVYIAFTRNRPFMAQDFTTTKQFIFSKVHH